MHMHQRIAGLALAMGLAAAGANAQAPADPGRGARDPCRTEVSRFENAISFVRSNQGNEAAAQLKEKLLPSKVESELLFKEGYCGLARYLKDKKLI
jgi:hypothetical protein